MKILAIETSTDACSCALWLDDELCERFAIAPREHGALVLSMVAELLAEGEMQLNRLDGFAFGCGPGAFTGLRIAAGVVQGLAFAMELPVAPISSLAALAQGISETADQMLVIQDARMGEVYYGAFQRGSNFLVRAATLAQVCRPEQITPPSELGQWIVIGSAWRIYSVALARALAGCAIKVFPELCYPRAGDVARLAVAEFAAGRGIAAEQALPIYLRDNVAVDISLPPRTNS